MSFCSIFLASLWGIAEGVLLCLVSAAAAAAGSAAAAAAAAGGGAAGKIPPLTMLRSELL